MNKWRRILMIVMMLSGSIPHAQADSQNSGATSYHRISSSPSVDITEQKAITIARQYFKGRVLAINHSDNAYRIKILSNQGTVHIVLINSTNGTVISTP